MPLGPPMIVGPVSTCSMAVRVLGQFSDARVRIYLEGDPQPVGDSGGGVGWADATVAIDRTRLVAKRKLVATQQLGPEVSEPSPKGQEIEPAVNAKVTIPYPGEGANGGPLVHACAQSLLLTGCSPGGRLEVWQAARGSEPRMP